MKVDNVTFVEVAVKGMTKEEFINAHIKIGVSIIIRIQ